MWLSSAQTAQGPSASIPKFSAFLSSQKLTGQIETPTRSTWRCPTESRSSCSHFPKLPSGLLIRRHADCATWHSRYMISIAQQRRSCRREFPWKRYGSMSSQEGDLRFSPIRTGCPSNSTKMSAVSLENGSRRKFGPGLKPLPVPHGPEQPANPDRTQAPARSFLADSKLRPDRPRLEMDRVSVRGVGSFMDGLA